MSTSTKVAFITGGNRGIGLQTAKDLGKHGVTVVIGAREASKATAALVELRAAGITADAIEYDAARPETDRAVVAYFEKTYGRLDILINNAGKIHGDVLVTDSSTVTDAIVRDTFEVNFFAVVRLTQALLPLLKNSSAGRIVNLSSVLGSLSVHSAPSSPIAPAKELAYNASKTALNAFTVHLAAELAGTNVKVNSAHPGWVKTDLGGPHAQMEIGDSSKTSGRLALLAADGPTGGFFHEAETLPW